MIPRVRRDGIHKRDMTIEDARRYVLKSINAVGLSFFWNAKQRALDDQRRSRTHRADSFRVEVYGPAPNMSEGFAHFEDSELIHTDHKDPLYNFDGTPYSAFGSWLQPVVTFPCSTPITTPSP